MPNNTQRLAPLLVQRAFVARFRVDTEVAQGRVAGWVEHVAPSTTNFHEQNARSELRRGENRMKGQKRIGIRGMRVKSGVKASGLSQNHNETLVHELPKVRGLRVKSGVKAGGLTLNHNETLVHELPKVPGLRVKSVITRPRCLPDL
jgi:hypothetical protein